jgi:hypothetical protein
MKTSITIIAILLAACGMKSADNEAVGQVKKIVKKTPLICSDYTEADISLGVLRNGVGSVSREDVELAVDNSDTATITTLRKAAESGAIVKFTYDVKRVSPCWPDHRLLTVEIEASPVEAK